MAEEPKPPSEHEVYRGVRDGAQLKALANGLIVVRRKKHEAIDLSGLAAMELVKRSSKVSGSKFAADWNLKRCVDWIEKQTVELGWTSESGAKTEDVSFEEAVGISRGKKVYTIRLVSDGRHVHAYPVE